MADLRALSRELARIYRRYGQKTQSKRGVPLYLTEYGYQTKPDPITRVSFNKQAAWINEAEYMAFKNPNVRAVNQFLLVDDAPVDGVDAKKNPRPRLAHVPERPAVCWRASASRPTRPT